MAKKAKTYDGRPLKEVLMSLSDSQMVKIGTDGGGAYFLAGTAGFILRSFKDNEPAVRKSWENRVANSENGIREAAKAIPTYSDFITSNIRKHFDNLNRLRSLNLTFEAYQSELKRCADRIVKKGEVVENFRSILNNYTPVLTRKVIETRESDVAVDPGCLIIMIDGYEIGTLWMLSESDPNQTLYLRADSDSEGEGEDG